MKLNFFLSVLGMAPLALAANTLKSVIITYPDGTPASVVDQAKDSLKAKGAVITHEYHLISGFAAEVPVNALQTFTAESTDYKPEIEEDQVVTISGDFEEQKHPL